MSENNTETLEKQEPNADQKQDLTPPTEKTFTQAEVNKMMTKEKHQGRAAAYKELGIDPKDAAMVEEVKKHLQSKKPESQVLAEQQLEHNAKIQEANHRAFLAEVKAEIMQAGVQLSFLDDAMALVTAKRTDETFDLTAAIDTIKTKYPVWFTATATDQQAGQKGTGSPVKPGSSVQTQTDDLGKRLAEQRNKGTVKATYWGSQQK